MKKNNTISLIDGSGFIFRAYYALPSLTNREGVPVGAVMGFCNMLLKLLEEKKTHKLLVIFDTARKTFRNDIYKNYKSNRGDPPEDLIPQFKIIREAVDAFNVSRVELEGYEADDLIATYANFFKSNGWNVSIVSSDKDLMQLVEENISMVDPIKNKVIKKEEVLEKFGVLPSKVIDVQSLAGDSIDNVPGAPGIGIKTAALLINEYGSLDNLLLKYDSIKQNKRREAIRDNINAIKISRKLVTLKKDINIKIDIDKISGNIISTKKLIPFLEKYNFNNLKARILKKSNESINPSNIKYKEKNYKVMLTKYDLEVFIKKANTCDFISIDTETDSLKATETSLVGISFSFQEGHAFYLPLLHKNKDHELLDIKYVSSKLNPVLTNKSILKIGQNIKFDILVLKNNGFDEVFPIDDTMLMSFTLSAGLHNHNLDYLAEKYLEYKKISYKEIIGSGKSEISFAEVEINKAKEYACEDADITLRLWKILKRLLIKNKLIRVYENIERPLINVIVEMENNGIKINKKKLELLSDEFAIQLRELQSKIFKITKIEFNINSTKQLGEVLFNKLGLKGAKKNKSGGFSTNSEVLEQLANEGHQIALLILEWREISKLKNTYTESLVYNISKKTQRIHTTFQMTGAQTGRLSSTDPNLQNIPIKSSNGKEIRKAFVSQKGYKLICLDYSQIELRLLSEIADITTLKDAFKEGTDIHKLTASQIFGAQVKDISEKQRRNAKAINFGIIYGLSAFGLSKQLGISRTEAKDYIEMYFNQYPGIQDYMQDMKEFLANHGYVQTLFGRRININGYNNKNPMIRNYADRQAINAPIQGTAADIIKRAMIKYFKDKKNLKFKDTNLLLQVHDELVFEIKNNDALTNTIKELKALMSNASEPIVSFEVPILVSGGEGNNWDEAH